MRQMRAFYRLSLLGSARGQPAEIASRVLREFAGTMGFRRAEIWLLDRLKRLRRLSGYGRVPAASDAQGVSLQDCPFGRSVVRRRQAVLRAVAPPGAPRRRMCHVGWRGQTSMFGAPLRGPDGPIGLLFADRGGRPFDMSATDLEVATALAGLITEVVKGALAREGETRRRNGLLLLNQVGRAISTEESLPILLPRLARNVREGSKVLGVVVALYDERASDFEVAAIAGPLGKYYQGFRFPAKQHRSCLSPRVLRSGRALRLDDLRATPEVCAYWPETQSVLVIPIRSKGKTLGTLRLEDAEPRAFDEEDIRLCSTLADQIGHAIRRARVIEALSRKQADLRAVSESLEKRLEEDRRRIARELHDELAQSMTAAKINLGLLRTLTRGAAPGVRRAILETEAVVRSTIEDTRRIAMDLRPSMLDELGLVPALRWYADTFSRRTGVGVDVQANGGGGPAQKDVNTLLFRFFQEALTNVARHARARHVRIGLSGFNGSLRAVVADDGIGMRQGGPPDQGLGLLGMRERIERVGGVLSIKSRPGRGTRLVADIPVRAAGRSGGRSRHAAKNAAFEGGLS
ncbi:MAG: hypothetical protein AUG03_03905 [Acidobacteria bacterium 13_1_20CM_2_68_14]|nr:MAG: hypothetical protein AUG03_03905 [Acidobacteria bacterium 13_1_20CM_2_68_14]